MFHTEMMLGARRSFLTLSLLWLVILWCPIQSKSAEPARITFSLDFPNSDPAHYSITVASDGHATYECLTKMSADSDDEENYQAGFEFSGPTRTKIFDLAAQAHYFAGKIDSGN